jgi:hypothetical protein
VAKVASATTHNGNYANIHNYAIGPVTGWEEYVGEGTKVVYLRAPGFSHPRLHGQLGDPRSLQHLVTAVVGDLVQFKVRVIW